MSRDLGLSLNLSNLLSSNLRSVYLCEFLILTCPSKSNLTSACAPHQSSVQKAPEACVLRQYHCGALRVYSVLSTPFKARLRGACYWRQTPPFHARRSGLFLPTASRPSRLVKQQRRLVGRRLLRSRLTADPLFLRTPGAAYRAPARALPPSVHVREIILKPRPPLRPIGKQRVLSGPQPRLPPPIIGRHLAGRGRLVPVVPAVGVVRRAPLERAGEAVPVAGNRAPEAVPGAGWGASGNGGLVQRRVDEWRGRRVVGPPDEVARSRGQVAGALGCGGHGPGEGMVGRRRVAANQ